MKIFFFLVLYTQSVFAIEGSLKNYLSELKDNSNDTYSTQWSTIARLKQTFIFNDEFNFQVAYEGNYLNQKTFDSSLYANRDYRVKDLNSLVEPDSKNKLEHHAFLQNLDRFNLNYSHDKINLTVGRQPIAFGSAKAINPTDVLTPFSYQDLNKEDRLGIDAIRFNYSLSELSFIEGGMIAGKNFETSKSAEYLKYKLNKFQTDLTTTLMNFKDNLLVGLDFARPINQASTWLEMAYVETQKFNDKNLNHQKYFRLSTGIDYKFNSGIYSYLEYSYNGAGKNKPEEYLAYKQSDAYLLGNDTYRAKNYLIPGFSYDVNPLLKLSAQFLINTDDHSTLNNLVAEYNAFENIYLSLGLYIPTGKKLSSYTQKSEFGDYPDLLYSSFRWYF